MSPDTAPVEKVTESLALNSSKIYVPSDVPHITICRVDKKKRFIKTSFRGLIFSRERVGINV